MTHYDKNLGVYLPDSDHEATIIGNSKLFTDIPLTPEEEKAILAEKQKEDIPPYRFELDEDEIDWWICNRCSKAYNSESVQKRHQTLKHK